MKKKNIKKRKKLIITFSIIILFFISIAFTIKDNRNLTQLEKILKNSISFINKITLYPFKNSNELNTKNTNQTEIDNLKKEIQELKDSLELNTLISDYEKINATVINRNLGYWYDTVIIDKGSSSGIKENMAVTTKQGLIGKIIKTTRNTSTVKLLTSDTNNKVSIQIKTKEGYLYGILNSKTDDNYYIVEGISNTRNLDIGSLVSTTGKGDIFPSGILIGEVFEINKDNFDLEAIIKVKPSINIDNFNYVTVLRRNQW